VHDQVLARRYAAILEHGERTAGRQPHPHRPDPLLAPDCRLTRGAGGCVPWTAAKGVSMAEKNWGELIRDL
jgi:hypothetical protein